MDENSKLNNVASLCRMYNDTRPLSVYFPDESKNISLSSSTKVLKPKEVIATVSKQLKDIQKADTVNKGRVTRIAKPKDSDFVRIDVLCSQEHFQPHDIHKFETQCVTDTQLIDLVDHVEAMVNVKIPNHQENQETSVSNDCSLKRKTIDENTEAVSSANKFITETDTNRKLENSIQLSNPNKKCINEINADIYKEFDTSYNEAEDKKSTVKSNKIVSKQSYINSSEYLCQEVRSSSLGNLKEAISNNKTEEYSKFIDKDNTGSVPLKDNASHKAYMDFSAENVDEKKRSSSPIFRNLKPMVKSKTLSPLTYPLDKFEKFESFAMSLIGENTDFEAAKHLINSQIIDNQLLISSNTVPILKKSTNDISCKLEHNEKNIKEGGDESETITFKHLKQVENKSTSLEDEILFSSDEENEYFHYPREDVPLTCALKTSFYGPEVNLDETLFVGFQTSSDKCIQVSKDSFIKAKQLFNSIDKENNDNLTLTELVDIYDSKSSHYNNNNLPKDNFDKDYENENEYLNVYTKNVSKRDIIKSFNDIKKEEFTGFKTANGKSIHISEKALIKCNTIFKDIDIDMGVTASESTIIPKKREMMTFKTASTKKIKSLEKSFENISNTCKEMYPNSIKPPLNMDINLNNFDEGQIEADYQGEENNKKCDDFIENVKTDIKDDYINIEDQVLIQEFENESIEEAVYKQIECNVLQMVVNKISKNSFNDKQSVGNSDLSAKFDPGISEYPTKSNSQDVPRYFGFKTANNKEIKVSNEALAKTKDLFHDIGFEDISGYKRDCINMYECNFNNEDITEHAHFKDKFSDKWDPKSKFYQLQNENIKPIFQNFKTASNKVVQISNEALLKSKKIFQDFDSINMCDDNILPKSIDEVIFNNNEKSCNKSFPFQGFKTASNKCVNVSEEAVAKTKKVFQDFIQYDINDNVGKSTHIVNNMKSSVDNHVNVSNFIIAPSLQERLTANKKSIVVPGESLLKTKKILKGFTEIDNNKDILFKAAECTTSYTSIEELQKNEVNGHAKFNEIFGLPTMHGFKTASNKQVAISDEALSKAKRLFDDFGCKDNISQSNKDNFDYLETAIETPIQTTSEKSQQQLKQNVGAFKGFQTASNKTVKVSEAAIARSRKIFDEINFDIPKDGKREVFVTNEDKNKENIEVANKKSNIPPVIGFKVVDSLNKSKSLCSDLGDNIKTVNKNIDILKCNKVSANDPKYSKLFNNLLDTQLLNNFEESLHTEDFLNNATPKQCKRSGSPILSCPKAKKRKRFETPYRMNIDDEKIEKVDVKLTRKSEMEYVFSENYKKTRLYSLKDLDKIDGTDMNAVIDPYILNFDFDSLLKFRFEGNRNDVTHTIWTTDNIKACFMESVDSKIIPEGWLDNHLKLILWKLISYETRFPNIMRGVCSVKNVLDQLKYRYDKELYRVERPALRKLLEKDDISTKTMVLAVAAVYFNGTKEPGTTTPSTNVELLLTDGWYCVKACLDRMLSRLVSEGKIAVGRKIATSGAELLNCEQGVSPWEDTSAVRLKIFGNSTRPARWDARLGYHAGGTILSQLSTIEPTGGKVCKTRALVLRVYPALYVEKLEDGSTVTRSERLEHLHQIKYESERQIQLEKLYEEVEKEFFDQESSGSEGMDTDLKRNLQSGSQLNRLMRKCNDPSQFRSHLTESQTQMLQEYSSRSKEKIIEELQKRVQDKIRSQGVQLGRNVIPLLKIRVAGLEGEETEGKGVKVTKAMISIWRPNEAILEVVKEGTWIDLFNVVPTAVRNGEVQISAGRQSVFHRSKFKENDKMKPYIESLQRKCFTMKNLNKIGTIQTVFNEIDTAGIVFLIEPPLNDFERIKGQQFQNVYLTDLDKNFICINFWGGIQKFGYENIFETGNVVACMNLQKRAGNTRKTIPQYRATELTVFTKTPKLDHLRNMIEEFMKQLTGLDKRKFCDDCVMIKNNYATIKNGCEYSPYRLNTSDYNLSRNKIFIDSPLVQNRDVNLNLTGLDFESTFQQADTEVISPAVLKQKQIAKEKIAKLKMYGEPPPLSKIHIINKSINAGSAYKSPLSSSVTRVKKSENSPLTRNELSQSSPVLSMNRTYVVKTGMNPVKLNFSTSLGDGKSEPNPFEEEFDASPPLSLE